MLVKNKKTTPQSGKWAIVLCALAHSKERKVLAEKISEVFFLSLQEAENIIDNIPIIILDDLAEGQAVELRKRLGSTDAEIFLTQDVAIKRKCSKTVWSKPPDPSIFEPENFPPKSAKNDLGLQKEGGPRPDVKNSAVQENPIRQNQTASGQSVAPVQSAQEKPAEKLPASSRELESSKAKAHELSGKIANLEQARLLLSETLEQRVRELQNLHEKYSQAAAKIQALESDCRSERSKREEAEEKWGEMKRQCDALHAENLDLQAMLEQRQSLENEVGALHLQKQELEAKKAALKVTLEEQQIQHQHQCDEYLQTLQELEKQCRVSNQEVESCKKQIQDLRAQCEGEAQSQQKHRELEEKHKALELENAALKRERQTLQTQLQQMTAEKSALNVEHQIVQLEIHQLRNESNIWEQARQDMQAQLQQIKSENGLLAERCQKSESALKTQLEEMNKNRRASEDENQNLRTQLEQLQAENEFVRKSDQGLQEELKQVNAQYLTLRNESGQVLEMTQRHESEKAALENALAEHQAAHQKAVEDHQRRCQELETRALLAEKEAESLKWKEKEGAGQVNELLGTRTRLEQFLQERLYELNEWRDKYAKLMGQYRAIESHYARETEAKKNLEKELLAVKNTQAEDRREEMKTVFEGIDQDELRKKIQQLEADQADLISELQNRSKETVDAKDHVRKLKEEFEKLQISHTNLEQMLQNVINRHPDKV